MSVESEVEIMLHPTVMLFLGLTFRRVVSLVWLRKREQISTTEVIMRDI
jgi:hypothetical protein